MEISVVIPTHNRGDIIEKAVISVQTTDWKSRNYAI